MKFKSWLNEAIVKFANIAEAIKKTLEFVVVDGRWQFEPKTYGLSSIKTVSVAGHFYCEKGHFFLSAHSVAEKPIDSYDSSSGAIDANSKIEIIASVSLIGNFNGYRLKKIAERSNTSGGRLHTPYQLAQWVKKVIDDYKGFDDDNDDEENEPTPTPSDSQLVSV